MWQLDPIVRWLWPIPVAGFVIYPYLKRFTWPSHLWLGAVDGLAPVGAWVAITGELPLEAWLLGGAVACWVAGFDFCTRCSTSTSTAVRASTRSRRGRRAGSLLGGATLARSDDGLLIATGVLLDVVPLYWFGVFAVGALLV